MVEIKTPRWGVLKCAGKLTESERIVCSDKFLAWHDVELSEFYKKAIEKFKANKIKTSEIKQSQNAWIRETRLKLDKDIHKSPSDFRNVIKKCNDYKEDSLFVCAE